MLDRIDGKQSVRYRLPLLALAVVTLAIVGGCGRVASPQAAVTHRRLTTVHVSMGFVQNVQFAPFYVAVKMGYYRSAGLDVSFNYQTEPNALQLLANGSVDFVDSGGDEVLTAAAKSLPVTYVMTQYSRFPSALFFLKSSHISRVADLKGKTVGVPGTYGASYYGLLALLAAARVPRSRVKVETIGYTQISSVASGKVSAAMGYAPNEPVELRAEGKSVGEFDVYKWANIAGAGIATSNALIAHKPALVRGFVQATLKGLRFTLRHPVRAFRLSESFMPGLSNPGLQRAVLDRALEFWKPAGVPLGHMDPKVWKQTAGILYRFKVIPKRVNAAGFYTNRFLG